MYLNKEELLTEILKCQEADVLSEKAKEMLILLANKTIRKKTYTNPMDKQDCLQTGILVLLTNWKNFDISKGDNAFAYYTEIFKRGIAKGFNDLYHLKGDTHKTMKRVSIESSNDGDGIYNL